MRSPILAAVAFLARLPLSGAEVDVSIDTRQSDPRGIELILAETNGKSYSTDAITEKGKKTWKWLIDASKGDVYLYLNHFYGTAYISIDVDGVPLFGGFCQGSFKDNQRLTDISKHPKLLKKSGFPSLVPARYEPVSFIRLSDAK